MFIYKIQYNATSIYVLSGVQVLSFQYLVEKRNIIKHIKEHVLPVKW